jgi:hypothetical protein
MGLPGVRRRIFLPSDVAAANARRHFPEDNGQVTDSKMSRHRRSGRFLRPETTAWAPTCPFRRFPWIPRKWRYQNGQGLHRCRCPSGCHDGTASHRARCLQRRNAVSHWPPTAVPEHVSLTPVKLLVLLSCMIGRWSVNWCAVLMMSVVSVT